MCFHFYVQKKYKLFYCKEVCKALAFLLGNILLDLELNFIDQLQVFRWELTVLHLFFVMGEFSWNPSHEKIRLTFRSTSWYVNGLLNEPRHDKTSRMSVRPAKTQISLGIRPVWSESLLCAQSIAKDSSFLHADSKDPDQTGRIYTVLLKIDMCRSLT